MTTSNETLSTISTSNLDHVSGGQAAQGASCPAGDQMRPITGDARNPENVNRQFQQAQQENPGKSVTRATSPLGYGQSALGDAWCVGQ